MICDEKVLHGSCVCAIVCMIFRHVSTMYLPRYLCSILYGNSGGWGFLEAEEAEEEPKACSVPQPDFEGPRWLIPCTHWQGSMIKSGVS